jgi:hypothetical protein
MSVMNDRMKSFIQQTMRLQELLTWAPEWDAEFFVADGIPVELLAMAESGLTLGKNRLAIDQTVRNRLFEKAGAPWGYMSERSIDVQMLALTDHLRQGAFGSSPKIVTRDGQLFTLVSDKLIQITHTDVLSAVADPLGAAADDLSVSRIDRVDGRIELELVSPRKAVEIRRGDIVQAGLHITHSRFGDQATQVQTFTYRLLCTNGMTRRECAPTEGLARTRRLPVAHPHGKELQLDQIRRLTAHAREKLEPQLEELRSTAERPADAKQLLKTFLQRARISTRISDRSEGDPRATMMDRIVRAWRDWGSEDTYYGAVNALTRVGTHDLQLSARQRRTLSMLGGVVAFSGSHLCPRCFSVLSENSGAVAEHATNETATA